MPTLVPLVTFPALDKDYRAFAAIYDLQRLVIPDEIPNGLKPSKERKCRFCKRTSAETTFKKLSHTIPHFLGNKHHVSDFECDECNKKFSVYESHLKNFLGAIPTLTKTKGKKGLVNFHSPNDNLTVRNSDIPLMKGAIEVSKKDIDSDAINANPSTREHSFYYTKPAYTPFSVYKSLLKIALCFIPENEIDDYQRAIDILWTEETAPIKKHLLIHKAFVSFNNRICIPAAFLFKKRDAMQVSHTHHFMLCYQNIVLQFPVPLRLC